VVLLLSEVKLKSFADLDTGVFVPVAAVEEGADSDAGAGVDFGIEGTVTGFAGTALGAATGAGGFSFSLLAPPPILSLIVFEGGGSTPVFSGVDVPPMFSLMVGAGAGACAGCSRSIGS
jgi:hypothetical protein